MNEKVAIVTGGGRGIGRAVCLALAAQGIHIVVNYTNRAENAQETVAACRALGVNAQAVQADVADAQACETLVAAALAAFGRVDILVNNAGVTRDNLLIRMTETEFDTVIATNLKGAFNMMKAVTRPMMKQRSGCILSVASVVGLMGNAGQINYAASKAGIIGMTKSAARELAARGIRANAVAPGFIETDMTAALPAAVQEKTRAAIPSGSFGTPQDVAAAVAFLASDAARYITGQVLCVDGGMCMQ